MPDLTDLTASLAELAERLAAAPAVQGYLAVDTARGPREYLLGAGLRTIDWRTAPLADVFFRHAPGELYELEREGTLARSAAEGPRGSTGRVVARYVVIRDGAGVAELRADDHRARRDTGWRREPIGRPAPLPVTAAEAAARAAAVPVLDPDQRRAVDAPDATSLVVDGEAGVGKTLVALHRVAQLAARAATCVGARPFRALALVPTEGLRRLCRTLAERLALTPAQLAIEVVDGWLVDRARRAFPGLPARTSESTPAQVIALKRHPAVRAALADFIAWRPPGGDDKLPRSRARLLHLFGDRDRLARIVAAANAASPGALPERAIAQTMQHTRRQFELTTERAHRHVDADRLVAVDGRALDAGTPAEDAHTFDVEDAPVLFELARRGALPVAKLPRYDHIVVDEAQLRAPMELAAIADALVPGGTVTLAGDHRQATDDSAWHAGWPAARAEFAATGLASWLEVTLAIGYRSVPAIAEFARAPAVPAEPPPDPAVWASRCPGPLAQAAALCWHLDALRARDPWRQIAIVARTAEHARRLHGELRALDPTLVVDGDFEFTPGIVVTHAAAVAGLEFDAVAIPDLAPGFYPPTPELARSLYVTTTRARDWLWLLTPDAWSSLVPLESGR